MKTIFSSVGFQDAQGNLLANGSLILSLPSGIFEIVNGGGQVAGTSVTVNLDATGKLPNTNIWCADELAGAPNHAVTLCSQANGLGAVGTATWTIAGASPIDVSFETPSGVPGVSIIMPSGLVVVPFSATPVFPASSGTGFQMTLTGNVSSSTMTGGIASQYITFKLIQDAVGGRTFAWPSNVKNPQPPDPTPNAISVQTFFFDGANAYPIGPMTVN